MEIYILKVEIYTQNSDFLSSLSELKMNQEPILFKPKLLKIKRDSFTTVYVKLWPEEGYK